MDSHKTNLSDTVGYLIFGNPLSQGIINLISSASKQAGLSSKKTQALPSSVPDAAIQQSLCRIVGRNYNFIRLAGVSGVAALAVGAYGKYFISLIEDPKAQAEAKAIFDTANRYHFLHTLALFCVPMAHNPLMTGSLFVSGTLLFSGSMYYRALTGDKSFINFATCGGFCLLAAWLSLIY